MAAPTGRFRRPIGRNRLKFLAARFLRHPMLKSSSFRTVCNAFAIPNGYTVAPDLKVVIQEAIANNPATE
jgi:hypothetical protein